MPIPIEYSFLLFLIFCVIIGFMITMLLLAKLKEVNPVYKGLIGINITVLGGFITQVPVWSDEYKTVLGMFIMLIGLIITLTLLKVK